ERRLVGYVVGPPVGDGYHAWVDQVESVEEPLHLRPAAYLGRDRACGPQLFHPHPPVRRQGVVGAVGDGEVTAGWQGDHETGDNAVRVVAVGHVVQQRDCRDRHRLGEVQDLGCAGEDLLRVTDVRVDVGGGALRGTGQQRPGVGEHDRV